MDSNPGFVLICFWLRRCQWGWGRGRAGQNGWSLLYLQKKLETGQTFS